MGRRIILKELYLTHTIKISSGKKFQVLHGEIIIKKLTEDGNSISSSIQEGKCSSSFRRYEISEEERHRV